MRKRVTTVDQNNTSELYDISFNINVSSSETFNLSLSSDEKRKVRTGASFEWEKSHSISFERTITLRPGEYGWWEYAPYVNRTWGYLKTFTWLGEQIDSKYVVGKSPGKLPNGDADGIYYAMSSYTQP